MSGIAHDNSAEGVSLQTSIWEGQGNTSRGFKRLMGSSLLQLFNVYGLPGRNTSGLRKIEEELE